jgi:hypothetical protein
MELMIFPLHLVPSDAKTKVNRGNGKTKKSFFFFKSLTKNEGKENGSISWTKLITKVVK